MDKPTWPIAVIMQRRPARSRWADYIWEPWSVLSGYGQETESRQLVDGPDSAQWLHPGFTLVLHKDEIEGYYLNVSAQKPRVFVLWLMDGEQGRPAEVTVSSEEGGRWLDGGHSVDGVAMPAEIFAWVGDYVEKNYRPEPQKRIKPRSFLHLKDR
jgi:hypothetical protein